MPSVPSHTKQVLAFLQGLYSARDESALVQHILDELPTLVSGDNFGVGQYDPRTRTPLNLTLRHPTSCSNLLVEAFESRAILDLPFLSPNPTPNNPIKILSALMTRREWESNTMFCDFLCKDGVRDHLTIEFSESPRETSFIGVARSRRGFRPRDQEILALLFSHFKQAFANVRLMQSHERTNGGDFIGATTLYPIDLRGRFLPSGQPQDEYWGRLFGAKVAAIFEALHHWISSGVDLLNRCAMDRAVAPFRVKVEHRVIEFRLHRQWGRKDYLLSQKILSNGSNGSHILTLREREVLQWVSEGKENSEIGIILEISKYTVRDHLKSIYAKLGVDNRTSAARMFQSQMVQSPFTQEANGHALAPAGR